MAGSDGCSRQGEAGDDDAGGRDKHMETGYLSVLAIMQNSNYRWQRVIPDIFYVGREKKLGQKQNRRVCPCVLCRASATVTAASMRRTT